MNMPFAKWECLLFSIVSIVPFIFLFYYTFKDRFRFSISRTILILIPFTLLRIVIQFAALFGYLQWLGLADILLLVLSHDKNSYHHLHFPTNK